MRKNNNEEWLVRMIQILNNLAWEINDACPEANIKPVRFQQGRKTSLTWLRNSLFRLTADIRITAEELNIMAVQD